MQIHKHWLRACSTMVALLWGGAVPVLADPAPDPDPGFVLTPSAEVPEAFAAFSGIWSGTWGGSLDHKLTVMSVGPDGTVEAIYAWGDYSQWKIKRGASEATGRVVDDILELDSFGNGARVSYQLYDGSLKGRYVHEGNTTLGSFIRENNAVERGRESSTSFSGRWQDGRGRGGPILIRADSAGVSSISFGATVCTGQRSIPKGELGIVDGGLGILGDGTFDMDIGGPCGPASVIAKEISEGVLHLEFSRQRHGDSFSASVKMQ